MRPISADVAWSVCVCVSVCVSVEHDHELCARITEAMELQFGAFTRVDPKNRVFSGGPDPLLRKRRFFREDFPVLTSTLTQMRL